MHERPDCGDALPDIALETPEGAALRPSDFRGRKLVLFFYPKDDTPGCTTENLDFSALAPEFEKCGAALLGISKDPPTRHCKFIAKHGLAAPLASDRLMAWLMRWASGSKKACMAANIWGWSAPPIWSMRQGGLRGSGARSR